VEVSGKFHAPGERTPGDWMGPCVSLDAVANKATPSLLPPRNEHRSSSPSLVSTLTELSDSVKNSVTFKAHL